MKIIEETNIKKPIWYTVIGLVIFIFIIAILGFLMDGERSVEILYSLDRRLLICLLSLSLINYILRAYRWHLTTQEMNLSIPFFETLTHYISGFSFTTTPGKLGEVLRLWFIRRRHKYEYVEIMPLFIIDKLSDIHGILLLCCIGVTSFSQYHGVTLGIAFLFLVLTLVLIRKNLLINIFRGMNVTSSRWKIMLTKVTSFLHESASLLNSGYYLVAVFLSTLGWLAECFALHILLIYLGVEVTFLQSLFIFTFSSIAGAATMLPGGLLGAEVTMFGLLLAIGCDTNNALISTFVIRMTTLWFAVALGFMTLPLSFFIARRGKQLYSI